MRRPLLIPLASLVFGISCAGLADLRIDASFLPPLLILTLAACFVRTIFFQSALALLLFCTGAVGFSAAIVPTDPAADVSRFASEEPAIVEGIVDSRPEQGRQGTKAVVHVERMGRNGKEWRAAGNLLLFVAEGEPIFSTGDRIRFVTKIRLPRNYGLPGEFDRVRFLACRKIFATASVPKSREVVLMTTAAEHRFQRRIDDAAARYSRFIAKTVSGDEGGVMRALILGERGAVPPELEEIYTASGLNYLLCISGFHFAVIAFILFQLIFRLALLSEFLALRCNLRRDALLLTLPVLVWYLFLTGAAQASLRSVIMAGICILALATERRIDPINTLMTAALAILGVLPAALFDVSFQLSFVAVWGMIVLTPIFMRPFERMPEGVAKKAILAIAVSAAAVVATLPPVAVHFHRVPLTGIVASLIIAPLLGYGGVAIGVAALPLTALFPPVARALLDAAGFFVRISDRLIAIFAKLPLLPPFNPGLLDLLTGLFFLSALTFFPRGRLRIACCTASILLFVTANLLHTRSTGLTIHFLSVGQAESTLVVFPGGETMLVDGGGSLREGGPDNGERLLAPALWSLGVKRIDLMVLSHPHPDHMGGLPYVATHFPVRRFWQSGGNGDSPEYLRLEGLLRKQGTAVDAVDDTTALSLSGGARLSVLAPFKGELRQAGDDVNDGSLVMRLDYGGFSMLFTGDIGADAEERLLKQHRDRLSCTVLKVPHHGSRFSSTPGFLGACSPRLALIGAGRGNSFHLPAEETLEKLRVKRIQTFRTDLDGTIRIISDGRSTSYVPFGDPAF